MTISKEKIGFPRRPSRALVATMVGLNILASPLAWAQTDPASAVPPQPGVLQTLPAFQVNPADQIPAVRKPSSIRDGFTLAATGDLIGPEIPVMDLAERDFAELVAILKGASVAVGNAETPIFDLRDPEIYPEGGQTQPVKPPVIAKEYARMGFRALNMAFNHAGDWSPEGLRQTQSLLNAAGIETMGYGIGRSFAQAPAYVNTRYGRVAFVGLTTTLGHPGAIASDAVGFTRGRAGVNALRLNRDGTYNVYDHYNQLRAIRFAKDTSDLAVLYVHSHEKPEQFQAFYRTAVDAGADAVIASYTVPERRGIEIYKGAPIFYGIAPFFYAMYEFSSPSIERYEGLNVDPRAPIPRDIIDKQFSRARGHEMFGSVIAILEAAGGKISRIRLIPIELQEEAKDYHNGHPRLANAEQGREILTAIAKASEGYGTKVRIERNVGIIDIPPGS